MPKKPRRSPNWEKLKYKFREDPNFIEAMDAFKDMRDGKKSPLGEYAEYLCILELEKISEGDVGCAIASLNHSTMKSYLGVFNPPNYAPKKSFGLPKDFDPHY